MPSTRHSITSLAGFMRPTHAALPIVPTLSPIHVPPDQSVLLVSPQNRHLLDQPVLTRLGYCRRQHITPLLLIIHTPLLHSSRIPKRTRLRCTSSAKSRSMRSKYSGPACATQCNTSDKSTISSLYS